MKLLLRTLLILVLISSTFVLKAQDSKLQSAYIYQFGRIMKWPNIGSEFVIAVWGDSDITPYIQKIAQIKQIQDKKIVVKTVSNVNQLTGCNIIFLPKNAFAAIAEIKKSINNNGVLLVSDKKGAIKSGAGISFIKVNDKMLFEIDKNNLETGGLKSSLSLERIAYKVN